MQPRGSQRKAALREDARVEIAGVPIVAVGQKPVLDAVGGGGCRRKDEITVTAAERGCGAFPLYEDVRPLVGGRKREACRDDDQAQCPNAGAPQT